MFDVAVIQQRKRVYGSNFEDIAQKWSKYLSIEINPDDVAYLMAEMKKARIEHIQKQIAISQASLDDSVIDHDNYTWIAQNFKEYEKL